METMADKEFLAEAEKAKLDRDHAGIRREDQGPRAGSLSQHDGGTGRESWGGNEIGSTPLLRDAARVCPGALLLPAPARRSWGEGRDGRNGDGALQGIGIIGFSRQCPPFAGILFNPWMTIRYRDSSVDSNIPGTSLDQGGS
jgi:hypothetical protein